MYPNVVGTARASRARAGGAYIWSHLPTFPYIWSHLATLSYTPLHLDTLAYIWLLWSTSPYIWLHTPTLYYTCLHCGWHGSCYASVANAGSSRAHAHTAPTFGYIWIL